MLLEYLLSEDDASKLSLLVLSALEISYQWKFGKRTITFLFKIKNNLKSSENTYLHQLHVEKEINV